VTIATRTVTVKGGHAEKVELRASKSARAKLGHETHPLEVTATPLGSQRDSRTRTFKTKIAVAADH
jgi:hypothetical protein